MQVPPIPPPLITSPLAQDVAAKAVPLAPAVTPLVQHAVDPSPKSEKSDDSGGEGDEKGKRRQNPRDKKAASDDGPDDNRGNSVNISV